jgi:hypothetical protein
MGDFLSPTASPKQNPQDGREKKAKEKRKEGGGDPVKIVLQNQEPATPARAVKLRCGMGYYSQFFRRCPQKVICIFLECVGQNKLHLKVQLQRREMGPNENG